MPLVRRVPLAAAALAASAVLAACSSGPTPSREVAPEAAAPGTDTTRAASATASAADLVVYGRIWTGDSTRPWAEALAVHGDTIAWVGDRAGAAAHVGQGTRVLDNGPALVTPGFNDGHVHFMDGGFQLISVDLRDAGTPEEFVRRIKAYAGGLQPGEWILGGNWDHEKWAGTPLPTRQWLDSVTPRNPVFVSRLDGHMAVGNSLAFKLAGVTKATKDLPGGVIVRDRNGEPAGVLKDEAMDYVYKVIPAPSPAQADSAVARASRFAASKGVTGVSAVSMLWEEMAALKRARAGGRLVTRVSGYVPLGRWREMAETLKVNGPGDGWLRLAGVKGYVDGSLGSRTALFFEPYEDDRNTRGLFVTPEDSLRKWIGGADSAGLQVVVHAIGERADAVLLDIFDSVTTAHGPKDRRFRDEHSQHLRPEDVARFAKIPVIASMQPYHAADDGRWAHKRLGARTKNSYVFRSLLDSGARLAFGSDWTVAPIDPLLGLHAADTRRTLDGQHPEGWIPEQKITLDEALRAYTAGNAYAVFAETKRGVLRPGMLADVVLLDRDLFSIAPETIDQAQVRATVAGGRVVYEAGAARP